MYQSLNYAFFHIYFLGGWGKVPHILLYSTTNINRSSLILLLVISFQKVHDSHNFGQNVHKNVINYAVSLKKNLGTTCHRTSLTFPETINTSEAQNYTKSALKSGPFGPPFIKQKEKIMLPVI